jgi:predicted RNA binding protein YcfA (HicA-like mRNA interferase family)
VPKLFSSEDIVRVLKKFRFVFVSQKGSHQKYRKDHLTVIVPANRKEIPWGTFSSILKQANLNKKDLE